MNSRQAESHEDVEVEQTDSADETELEAILNSGLEASGFTVNSVRWAPVDDEQPDYRHLDTRLAGKTFEFTPDDLATLITTNAFQPLAGKIIFGLRGARLVGGAKRENVTSITVTDQRPDHRDFRCIIGIYDPAGRRLWAYQASTVPNAAYVFKCFSESQRRDKDRQAHRKHSSDRLLHNDRGHAQERNAGRNPDSAASFEDANRRLGSRRIAVAGGRVIRPFRLFPSHDPSQQYSSRAAFSGVLVRGVPHLSRPLRERSAYRKLGRFSKCSWHRQPKRWTTVLAGAADRARCRDGLECPRFWRK